MEIDHQYPTLNDIRQRAKRRLPRFVWEYLDSGTGEETAKARTGAALDAVTLTPRALKSAATPDLSVTLMGRRHQLPFGFAPVGMSGLVWPGTESMLARTAAREGIPFCLSTVAAASPEDLAPDIGDQGWFQLYAPGQPDIRRDMLARARDAGFHTLILTADVPVPSRRERLTRAGITNPMRMTPSVIWQAAQCPAWALATARSGIPTLRTLAKYADTSTTHSGTGHVGYQLRTAPDRAYLETLRREWAGKLVVKGVLHPVDAADMAELCDAIWVSNHGGRQFDAGPAPIDALVTIRDAVGPDMPLICDGAVRGGTDILRLLSRGADFVMLGRAPHWGAAAFGQRGVDHVVHVLRAGMVADMGQLGLTRLPDIGRSAI